MGGHLSDQLEDVGVAFLQADEVKKACEEFAQTMKESTMAEMTRHYKKGLNTLIEIGAGGYPEATMTEIYQNSHYVGQVRETIVHTLMLERACDEMKDSPYPCPLAAGKTTLLLPYGIRSRPLELWVLALPAAAANPENRIRTLPAKGCC